ncbi:MAG: efflux RND transporter periplasmic adaptor subunit, partial [Thermoanaerobaculia bacterium]
MLTGELAAVNAAVVTVPRTPNWMIQIRWMEAEGTAVKRGQKVIEFDSSSFAATVQEKELAFSEAKAELARFTAESVVRESEKIFKAEEKRVTLAKAQIDAGVPEELRSKREHQDKQLARDKATAELAKAQDELAGFRKANASERAVKEISLSVTDREIRLAQDAMKALVVTAPQDGLLLIADHPRDKRKFQMGDTIWVGATVMRIPDLTTLRVEALLYDVDDGRLVPGDRVVCALDGFPARAIGGQVTDIAPVAQQPSNESLRRGFRVLVSLDKTESDWMRPGMSVKIERKPRGGSGAESAKSASAVIPAPAPDNPEEIRVKREEMVVGVEVRGTLQARDSDRMGAPPLPNVWDYKISKMASEGKTVKKGEMVLAFDTSKLAERLAEISAQAEAARKQIERRQVELDLRGQEVTLGAAEAEAKRRKANLKTDIPKDLVQAVEIRKAQLDLELAEKEVEFLKRKLAASRQSNQAELAVLNAREDFATKQVREIKSSIEKMTLLAPRDGTVIHLTNWRDEKKKVGDSTWPGERLLEIPDLTRMLVKGEVDEAEASALADGQTASLHLETHTDVEFEGKVSSIQRVVQRVSVKN